MCFFAPAIFLEFYACLLFIPLSLFVVSKMSLVSDRASAETKEYRQSHNNTVCAASQIATLINDNRGPFL